MPKKSFLEKMGLVERSNRTDDSSVLSLKRDTADNRSNSDATQKGNTVEQQVVDQKLLELERRKKLLDDFNAGNTTSFGFAGNDILDENKSVSLEDIIPNESFDTKTKDSGDVDFDGVGASEKAGVKADAVESEFAAAAEAMKSEDDLFAGINLNLGLQPTERSSDEGGISELQISTDVSVMNEPLTDEGDVYDNREADREREINRSIDELMGINKLNKFNIQNDYRENTQNADIHQNLHQQDLYQNDTILNPSVDLQKSLTSNEDMMLHINTDVGTEKEVAQGFDFSSINHQGEDTKFSGSSSFTSMDFHAEEVSYVEEGNEKVPFHTQIADHVGDDLRADENLKNPSSFKLDPYIGDKLDLIIGAYEKNKLLTIEEIYRNSRMETDTKKTIFMTDVFLQAIPANLPLDVKRETVLNILKISGIELEMLLSDAYKRIDSLNKVHEDTIATSNDIYQRNENTIRELERRIQDLKDINSARQVFQEDQNTMIEYEVQKIINLVEFVKPKTR